MTERISTAADGADAARSALERCIGSGGVVAFPADGLYGLACDPLSEAAVERIQRLKGRPQRKPSAVMYFSPLAMRELVEDMGPRTREAAAGLLPGPVTLVIANPRRRYPLACREDPDRLGVRLIEGPLAGAMTPVFQTSANRSGDTAPHSYEGVAPEILAGADLAIDGGELTGEPSTVVDLTRLDVDGTWEVLREGGLAVDALEATLGAAASRPAP
jgi:L-threonylcarbamoyladenylate synthase